MNNEFGTPLEGEEKKSNTTTIIIVVVLVVLCLCCLLIGGSIWALWTYGDYWFGLTSAALPLLL